MAISPEDDILAIQGIKFTGPSLTEVVQQASLEWRLDNLGMKRTWEKDKEDNLAPGFPILLQTYIDPQTKLVSRVYLRLRLMAFRSYAETTEDFEIGTLFTRTAGVWWSGAAGLDYATLMTLETVSISGTTGTGGTDSHTHGFSGSATHDHLLFYHYHDFEVPAHKHIQKHGIYEGTTATGVGIIINGIDRTADLGGPFTTHQNSLDITRYISPIGWNTIELTSAVLGRVYATMFIESYLP